MPNNDTLLLQNLLQQIETLNKEIKSLKTPAKAVYTNKEMLELLDISTVTLKKWRNRGYISYTQVGSTYYYSAKDLEEFLKNNHNQAYAYD